MNIVVTIIIILIAFLLGMIAHIMVNNFIINKKITEKKDELNSIFKMVLNNINNRESIFKTRVLQTVYITVNTTKTGIIDVIYLLDKNDVAIIKNNKVEYTSEGVDREIIDGIISSINAIHGREINDVVNIFGILISKKDFESTFKIKIEDFNNIFNGNLSSEMDSEIDKIKNNNRKSFDLDDILDKIGKHGMSSLTAEEKKYLNDYSNGRKD